MEENDGIYIDIDGNYVVPQNIMHEIIDVLSENGIVLKSLGKTPYCCLAWKKRDTYQVLENKYGCDAYWGYEAEEKCRTWYKNSQYNDGTHEKQLAQDDCTEFDIGQQR